MNSEPKKKGIGCLGAIGIVLVVSWLASFLPKEEHRGSYDSTSVSQTSSDYSSNRVHHVKTKCIAGYSKEAFEKAVRFSVDNDTAALARLAAEGQITLLKAGTEVYLEDVKIFSGTLVVRRKGSTETLWVATEHVD